MSPAGRFLKCKDCLLCFDFPDGEQYHAVAKQFESHLCGSPAQRVSRAGKERSIVLLRYEGRVPVMAACARCERKFFVPATFARDPFGADEYLRHKFHEHECEDSRLASGPSSITLLK
jgi:hypothetical protein